MVDISGADNYVNNGYNVLNAHTILGSEPSACHALVHELSHSNL